MLQIKDFSEGYEKLKKDYFKKIKPDELKVALDKIFEKANYESLNELKKKTKEINKECSLTRTRFRTKCFELYIFKFLETLCTKQDIKYERYLYYTDEKKENLRPDFSIFDGRQIVIECKSELDQEIWEVAARSLTYKKHWGIEKVYLVCWNKHRKMEELVNTLEDVFNEYFLDGIFDLSKKEDFEKFKNEITNLNLRS